MPAWLLLIDAKDKSSQLKTNLADLRKKWIDSGRKLKAEKIRDVEFTTLTASVEDLAKTLAKSLSDSKTDKQDSSKEKPEESKPGSKASITLGQKLVVNRIIVPMRDVQNPRLAPVAGRRILQRQFDINSGFF